MNNRIPPHRQSNPRLNAVAHSALKGTVGATTRLAPAVPLAPNATDPILALLEKANNSINALTALVILISKEMKRVENDVCKYNDADAYLKKIVEDIVVLQVDINNAISAGNQTAITSSIPDFSSLMNDDFSPGKRYPKISKLIKAYLGKTNFFSTDRLKVRENDEKPAWSLTTPFKSVYNQALAMTLITYLRHQDDCIGVSINDLGRIVKNHYRNQIREFRTSPDKIAARQKSARRRGRKLILLKRRKLAYEKYKDEVNSIMEGLDCSKVLNEAVMSDDETDTEHQVRAYRPSWRSDELQKFIDVVDDFAVKKLQKRSSSLLKRVRFTKSMCVPADLAVSMPEWTIKKE